MMTITNGDAPKITVISGFYNRSDCLNLTIDSIMNQTYSNFEFIVFNDCSTDDTKDRLEEVQKKYSKDSRLKIINFDANKGFVRGMKHCIEMARGDYICVQGSGDYSHPRRLELQAEVLDEYADVSVVGCFYDNYVEDTGVSRLRNIVSDFASRDDLYKKNYFSHGEVMYRKSDYEKVGGYREFFKNCQDYDLWFRLREIGKFYTVKELLYRRYIRYDGVTYKPEKFLVQMRYAHLCREVNSLDKSEQAKYLNDVSSRGIKAEVDISTKVFQKKIIRSVLRSLVWGKAVESKELAAMGISSKMLKYAMFGFIQLYSSRYLTPLRRMVGNYFDVKGA